MILLYIIDTCAYLLTGKTKQNVMMAHSKCVVSNLKVFKQAYIERTHAKRVLVLAYNSQFFSNIASGG